MNVEHILQNILWQSPAFIGGIIFFLILIIVFRERCVQLLSKLPRPLAQLFSHISLLKYAMGKHTFQIEFGQQVQKAKARAKGIEETVAASRAMAAPNLLRDVGKQTARDIVLTAWGALQQIVYVACTASKMPLTPVTGVPEAAHRLGSANVITAETVYLLDVLYELGQKLADDPGLRPHDEDARGYKELADVVVDWMMLRIASWKVDEPKRGGTVVGGHVPQPRSGYPVALLVGVGGPVRGQRFSITKEHYRIGSNTDNDLCITGDDDVSGHHASLHYEKGSLFLFDEESRKGSFLNEEQVTGTPVLVRQGNHIRFGKSIFQVAEAPTEPSPGPRRDRTRVE